MTVLQAPSVALRPFPQVPSSQHGSDQKTTRCKRCRRTSYKGCDHCIRCSFISHPNNPETSHLAVLHPPPLVRSRLPNRQLRFAPRQDPCNADIFRETLRRLLSAVCSFPPDTAPVRKGTAPHIRRAGCPQPNPLIVLPPSYGRHSVGPFEGIAFLAITFQHSTPCVCSQRATRSVQCCSCLL